MPPTPILLSLVAHLMPPSPLSPSPQVTDVMRSGPMNQEKSAYLEELRGQLGLGKEAADKVIKATRSEVYGTSHSFVEEGGRWTIDRIKEVNKAGGSIDGMVEEVTRRNIFRKELERAVTDGELGGNGLGG